MEGRKGKLSLWLFAALLLVSSAQHALAADAAAQEQEDAVHDSQAPTPEKVPEFDAATKLLMWVQQNEGVVRHHALLLTMLCMTYGHAPDFMHNMTRMGKTKVT